MKTIARRIFQASALAFCGFLLGCAAPVPRDVYIVLDTSGSFSEQQPMAQQAIETLVSRLDPVRDRIFLFRMDQQGVFLLREGYAPSLNGIQQTLNAYSQTAPSQYQGTPYREALERVQKLWREETPSALLVLGDLANEAVQRPEANLTREYLQTFGEAAPAHLQVAFIGVNPKFEQLLDPLRQQLGSRLLVVTAAEEQDTGLGTLTFLEHIQR